MSSNIYTAGLRNVGSYQVSGIPYLTASHLALEQTKRFAFPYVTKNIIVQNTGSTNAVQIMFVTSSTPTSLVLPAGKALNMDVKCKQIYIYSHVGETGIQMAAELTTISTGSMYSLEGLEGA